MTNISERRNKPRIDCDYPVIVEGRDSAGNDYHENAKLVNLSASGSFMIVDSSIEYGKSLSMTIFLANVNDDEDIPKILTNGVVVRTEPQKDGSCGVAVKFDSYRFL